MKNEKKVITVEEAEKRLEEIELELDNASKKIEEATEKSNVHMFSAFNIKKGALEAEKAELLALLNESESYSLK